MYKEWPLCLPIQRRPNKVLRIPHNAFGDLTTTIFKTNYLLSIQKLTQPILSLITQDGAQGQRNHTGGIEHKSRSAGAQRRHSKVLFVQPFRP